MCNGTWDCDSRENSVTLSAGGPSSVQPRERWEVKEGTRIEYFGSETSPEGEDDEDINTIVTPTAPAAIHTRPITRARARQLNYQVLSFLGNDSNVHENMMLPKLDTFVLLTNEGPSLEKDEHWSKNKHGDDAMRKGNKNGVTSDDFRTLKPP